MSLEGFNPTKLASYHQAISGAKPYMVDGFFDQILKIDQILALEAEISERRRKKVKFKASGYDLDGVLCSPDREFSEEVLNIIDDNRVAGLTQIGMSNNPTKERIAYCKDIGFDLHIPTQPKPDILSYKSLCEQAGCDPSEMLFSGDTLHTDSPHIESSRLPLISDAYSWTNTAVETLIGIWGDPSNVKVRALFPWDTPSDIHPDPDSRFLGGNIMIRAKKLDTDELSLERKAQLRIFRGLANCSARQLNKNWQLITDETLDQRMTDTPTTPPSKPATT